MAFRFVRGYSAWHSGIDLSAPTGTPVHAVNGGQVRFAGSATSPAAPSIARGGGNVVVVRVGSRDEIYAHLNSVRTFTGATVPRGALVGTVGATGNATGPHLHYAWWVNGRSTAPTIGTAELIAAVSGSGPGAGGPGGGAGTVVPVETGEHTTNTLRILETYCRPAIGRLSWRAALAPTGTFEFWNIGNPNNPYVYRIMSILDALEPEISRDSVVTAADYERVRARIAEGSVKDALGTDPLGLGAAAEAVVNGAAGIVKGAGQVAILAVLAFAGFYLLVKGK